MLALLLLLFAGITPQAAPTAPSQKPADNSASKIDPELGEKLSKVRRIYVESFGDDVISKQLQDNMKSTTTDHRMLHRNPPAQHKS
jgi:hypothetical protein